jgi:diacylglycerol kinase (ATP)
MNNKPETAGTGGYNPLRKIRIAVSGLLLAMNRELTVYYKVILSGIGLAVCIFFGDWLDALFLLLASGLVIMAELLNTSIEGICDYIQPEVDERIGHIKDVAAAAVLVVIPIWLIVLVLSLKRSILG